MATSPYLEVVTPAGRQKVVLGDQPITIGRSPDNVIPIDEAYASRYHCVIEPGDGGFRVRDLGSRNGTLLNNKPVTQSLLGSGDQVKIGRVVFVYNPPEGSESTPAPPPAARPAPPAKAPAPPRAAGAASPARAPTAPMPQPPAKPAPPPAAPPLNQPKLVASEPPEDDEETADMDVFSDRPSIDLSGDEPAPLDAFSKPKTRTPMPGTAAAATNPDEDPLTTLERLADIGSPNAMTEEQMALCSSRGQIIHAADSAKAKGEGVAESIRMLRLLLLGAVRTRASDLHFEPKGQQYHIRMRVDGSMVPVVKLTQAQGHRLLSSIKVLCDIDISQKNVIQEGHFSCQVPGRSIDYRISYTPAMHGQKLVIRVLDLANAPQFLDQLNLPRWMLNNIRKTAKQDAGMVLVCGPTGSGKTTTLYAVLRDIDVEQRNVITIEDPVEYQIGGVTQIPINEGQGNTFHTLLRSVLRQDPDVILLGEVRDRETADTAMQAAMTGHLVLSTVHAKDTIGTIFRLLDLGVEPYLVAQALNVVLAQRLIRKLCDGCKAPKKPTPQQTMRMGGVNKSLKSIYYPVGCPRCLNTGFMGRRGLYELLTVSDALRDVILKHPTMASIHEALGRDVFISLQEMGYQIVAEGATAIEEVDRVCGSTT